MANETKNTTPAKTAEDVEVTTQTKTTKKPLVPKNIDLDEYVTVKNGFQGTLVYINPKTGESITWERFGDEQEMTLRELKDAKNNARRFFEDNYFMFDEDWIISFLGVDRYYKNAVKIEDFDDLFKKKPEEVKTIVSGMSKGQKQSVRYRAAQLIHDGEFDSLKVISALEEVLGVELIEK